MTSFPRRRLLAAAAALATLALSPGCGASPAYGGAPLVRVDVLDRDSGSVLRVYRDHGRPVVAGRPGARYAVRLSNTSGERVLAVLAIDGVNAITGETASAGQRGYVLEPWQSADITGWRKSDEQVAAFEFTALSDSYAARTGRPLDVGVIGVAVFREAQPLAVVEEPPPPRWRKASPALDAARPAPAPEPRAALGSTEPSDAAAGAEQDRRAESNASPRAPAPGERLGTGHGARETSIARNTTFERASSAPAQQVAIRYDSVANLIAAGIVPPPRVAGGPRPFPADPPQGFVPDPPSR